LLNHGRSDGAISWQNLIPYEKVENFIAPHGSTQYLPGKRVAEAVGDI